MSAWLLALNVGSSSVKFAAFPRLGGRELLRGSVSNVGDDPQLTVRREGEASTLTAPAAQVSDLPSAIDHALETVFSHHKRAALAGAGHRIVHGGALFTGPALLTPETIAALRRLEPLAPLHQPASLAAIDLLAQRAPGIPQWGCFDTAFHARQPRLNQIYALPAEVTARGVRRFGFHGLSYDHVAHVLAERYGGGGRTVAAHLGAGASLCALKDGASVATSMGMTPLGGIPMATRPGDLDPGALLYLFEELAMSATDVRALLYQRSGLLGVSGESGDMRALLASTRPQAGEAVALFVEAVQREIASLGGALGGIDTLVFTGGVGEHAPLIRARVCAACAWMGVTLDPDLNQSNADEIHAAGSAVRVAIVAADEEATIIRQLRDALASPGAA